MLDDIILHPLRIEKYMSDAAAGMHSPVYDGVAAGLPDKDPVAEIIVDGRYRMKCYE